MIEKSKIKKGLIFWKSCESVIRIPNSNIYIKSPAGLMQIEEFVNYNLVTCSLYCIELFGAQVLLLLITLRNTQQKLCLIMLTDRRWCICITLSLLKGLLIMIGLQKLLTV